MWEAEDMYEGETWHAFNLDIIESERKIVQAELLRMYNSGEISGEQMVEKLKELKCILKIIYDEICNLHNLTELG